MAKTKTNDKPPKGQRGALFNRLYMWRDWLKPGKTKRLMRFKHYVVSDLSFAQQVRQAASKLGVSVSIKAVDGGMEVSCAAR